MTSDEKVNLWTFAHDGFFKFVHDLKGKVNPSSLESQTEIWREQAWEFSEC